MDNVVRSGTFGMKWYHRYHQSYETKPTRSGRIGEEHGEAAKRSKKVYDKNGLDFTDYYNEVSSKKIGLDIKDNNTAKARNEMIDYINSRIDKHDSIVGIDDTVDSIASRDKKFKSIASRMNKEDLAFVLNDTYGNYGTRKTSKYGYGDKESLKEQYNDLNKEILKLEKKNYESDYGRDEMTSEDYKRYNSLRKELKKFEKNNPYFVNTKQARDLRTWYDDAGHDYLKEGYRTLDEIEKEALTRFDKGAEYDYDGESYPWEVDKDSIKNINKMAKKYSADFNRSDFGLTSERVIPAGTKMYRTTVDPKEAVDGPKYVSYMDVDRNLYKGGWVRKTGVSKASYENTYELKEDLRIPGNETVNEAINKVILKDKTLTKEAVKSWENMLNKYGNTEQIFKDAEEKIKNPKKMTDLEKAKKELEMTKLMYIQLGIENSKYYTMTPQEYMKEYNNENKPENIRKGLKEDYGTDKYSTYINNKVKELRNKSIEEATFTVAQTYGKNTNAKNKVIAELKKQGYNAMPDYASIGGVGSFNKEGIDPLIVFDGGDSLNKKKVSGIVGTPGANIKKGAKVAAATAATVGMITGAAYAQMAAGLPFIYLGPAATMPMIYAMNANDETNAKDKYTYWNRNANSKSSTWRGSFVLPFDLLRTNINDINLSISDILRSGIV